MPRSMFDSEGSIFEMDYNGSVELIKDGKTKNEYDGFVMKEKFPIRIREDDEIRTTTITNKMFVTCDELNVAPSKTTIVGRSCSVTSCDCEDEICNKDDYCSKPTYKKTVVVDRIIPSADVSRLSSFVNFELEKYEQNKDELKYLL